MEEKEEKTRLYEFGYVLKGDLGEEKALEISELIRKALEDEQGIIIKENKPQKQNLGYPIKNHKIGYAGFLKFIFPVGKIVPFKKNLEKFDLLRSMISQAKHEGELAKRSLKRRVIRQSVSKEAPLGSATEEAKPKIAASPAKPASTRGERGEPLQVEEIDKKLEEILGQ